MPRSEFRSYNTPTKLGVFAAGDVVLTPLGRRARLMRMLDGRWRAFYEDGAQAGEETILDERYLKHAE